MFWHLKSSFIALRQRLFNNCYWFFIFAISIWSIKVEDANRLVCQSWVRVWIVKVPNDRRSIANEYKWHHRLQPNTKISFGRGFMMTHYSECFWRRLWGIRRRKRFIVLGTGYLRLTRISGYARADRRLTLTRKDLGSKVSR